MIFRLVKLQFFPTAFAIEHTRTAPAGQQILLLFRFQVWRKWTTTRSAGKVKK